MKRIFSGIIGIIFANAASGQKVAPLAAIYREAQTVVEISFNGKQKNLQNWRNTAGLSEKEISGFLKNDEVEIVWFRFQDGRIGGVSFSKAIKCRVLNQSVIISGEDGKIYSIPKQILKAYVQGKIEINWEKWLK